MKIINSQASVLVENDPIKKIEKCGRVCYKSEDKITEDSAEKFVANIIKKRPRSCAGTRIVHLSGFIQRV